ncbi:MAG: response regulator transcription factor [Dehalococcoidia bacterium]
MSSTGNYKILLIEDDSALRQTYSDMLVAEGYTVVTAEDGEQGLAMVRIEKPDVVLLDIILPKLPGFEVLKSIRDDAGTKDTIILVLSVMGEQRHIQKAIDLGANGYAIKGSNTPSEVLEKIRTLLAPPEIKEQVKEEVKEYAKSYNVFVKGDRGDMLELAKDIGTTRLLVCKSCGRERQLVLTPDTSRSDGHWFSAHFACLNCGEVF